MAKQKAPLLHVHPRARILLPFFLGVLIALTVDRFGCTKQDPGHLELSGSTMGTTWNAKLAHTDRVQLDSVRTLIQVELDRVDSLLSTYRDHSELMDFNHSRSIGWTPVSGPFLSVLQTAQEVSRSSDGALDITLAPVIRAWGFGAGGERTRIPSPDTLNLLRERTGPDKILVDPAKGVIRKSHPRLTLDLSAVAKGYGADLAGSALSEAGYQNFLLEVGGELVARGTRDDGRPWRVAIERPEPDRRLPHEALDLADMAMATSGDYRNYYEEDGQRLSHIISPRTFQPISHRVAAVSVLHEQCAYADAWATALLVLGKDEGLRVAEAAGVAAYFIARLDDGTFETFRTSSFPEE